MPYELRGYWIWDVDITDSGDQAISVGADRDIRIWSLNHKQNEAQMAFSYTAKKTPSTDENSHAKTIVCQEIFKKIENDPDKSISDHDFERILQAKEGFLGCQQHSTPHNAPIYSVLLHMCQYT